MSPDNEQQMPHDPSAEKIEPVKPVVETAPQTLNDIFKERVRLMEEANQRRDEASARRQREVQGIAEDPDADLDDVTATSEELDGLDREAETVLAETEQQAQALVPQQPESKWVTSLKPGLGLTFADPDGSFARKMEQRRQTEDARFEKQWAVPEGIKPGTAEYATWQLQKDVALAEREAARFGKETQPHREAATKSDSLRAQDQILLDLRSQMARGLPKTEHPTSVDYEMMRIFRGLGPETAGTIKSGDLPLDEMAAVVQAYADDLRGEATEDGKTPEEVDGTYIGGKFYTYKQALEAADALYDRLSGESQGTEESETSGDSGTAGEGVETAEEPVEQLSTEQVNENYELNRGGIKFLAKDFIPSFHTELADMQSAETKESDLEYLAVSTETSAEDLEISSSTEFSRTIVKEMRQIAKVLREQAEPMGKRMQDASEIFDMILTQIDHNLGVTMHESAAVGSEFNRDTQHTVQAIETTDPALHRKIARSIKPGVYMDRFQPRKDWEPMQATVSPEQVTVYKYVKK